jgi:hypothetical protein
MSALKIRRRWFLPDLLTLPSGVTLKSMSVCGAFDVGFPCQYCRKDLQGIYAPGIVTAPSGVATPYLLRVGYECTHCRVAALDFSEKSEWLPLVEFLQTKLRAQWEGT